MSGHGSRDCARRITPHFATWASSSARIPRTRHSGSDADHAHLDQVALWRTEDTEPATEQAKNEYFDTVHHARAVVGLNSTSLIETAIIGRPALSMLTPEYAPSQEGTMHFELIAGPDGMLIVGRSWEEHLDQLARVLEDPDADKQRRLRFVHRFIRPYGLDAEATGIVVDAIEHAAGAGSRTTVRGTSWGPMLLRAALTPLVYLPMKPVDKARGRARKERARDRRRLLRALKKRWRRVRKLRRRLQKSAAPAPSSARSCATGGAR